jgi:hypothetical protein
MGKLAPTTATGTTEQQVPTGRNGQQPFVELDDPLLHEAPKKK